MNAMELKIIPLAIPDGGNIILGQCHFIKTAEDLYEIITTSCPHAKFGIAFCEASGPCLVRVEGNDETLRSVAGENAMLLGAGHAFVIILKDAFPISVLNAVKSCPEVCNIFCATANPVQAIISDTGDGRGILGVVDGAPPKGVETEADVLKRKEFLRMIGYKR
jgi:adenosine/AMP kinase